MHTSLTATTSLAILLSLLAKDAFALECYTGTCLVPRCLILLKTKCTEGQVCIKRVVQNEPKETVVGDSEGILQFRRSRGHYAINRGCHTPSQFDLKMRGVSFECVDNLVNRMNGTECFCNDADLCNSASSIIMDFRFLVFDSKLGFRLGKNFLSATSAMPFIRMMLTRLLLLVS